MAAMTMKLAINCPFCDESAYQKHKSQRLVMPHRIYTERECPMGHIFYSVEEVPENQAEIVEEIRKIRTDRRKAVGERIY